MKKEQELLAIEVRENAKKSNLLLKEELSNIISSQLLPLKSQTNLIIDQ
jgi:hypothetical protein